MNTRPYLRLLRTFALAALTAAAVAACTDDNGDPDGREPLTPDDNGIAVAFTADINPGSDADPAAAPDTRTVLTPTTGGGFTVAWKGRDTYADSDCDKINIRAVHTAGTQANSGNPVAYLPATSAVSSALEPQQQGLSLSSEGEWTFTAVYGNSEMTGNMAYAQLSSLTQSAPNSTDHIAAQDFSVATATQTVAANSDMPQTIGLKFNHLLSALQLKVTNATDGALNISEIRLSVKDEQITSRKGYDVATGKWETGEGTKSNYLQLTIAAPEALANGGAASQNFHMLLFPGYANTDMTITVITDRGEYTLTKGAPGTGFAAGHNYLTDIAVKSSGLTDGEETWTEYVDVSTADQLKTFRDNVNSGDTYQGKIVRLTANIDLANETWTTPIGTGSSKYFSGTFDGGGHLISNLNVDNGSNSYAGLFGFVKGGTVRNLRVSGTVTTTVQNTGGIAGYLNGSTVENCIFGGTVSGHGNVGGIAGSSMNTSRIAGCHTKGTVTATSSNNAGGIAGLNYGSAIDGCYSEAEVKAGYTSAGGVAGSNQSGGTVTHCYATGKVSGKKIVGGIVGWNMNSITGCIALNPGLTRTEGSETDFGRIVGNNQGTVNSCAAYDGMTFTDATVSFTGTGEAGTALTAAQCLTASAYTSRGFTEADATTAGWAFDTAATWTYLPWNPAFESFSNIQPGDYRISVPPHLNGGGAN